MEYFTKTEYWRHLVPNNEGVEETINTTNKYFKNNHAPYVA